MSSSKSCVPSRAFDVEDDAPASGCCPRIAKFFSFSKSRPSKTSREPVSSKSESVKSLNKSSKSIKSLKSKPESAKSVKSQDSKVPNDSKKSAKSVMSIADPPEPKQNVKVVHILKGIENGQMVETQMEYSGKNITYALESLENVDFKFRVTDSLMLHGQENAASLLFPLMVPSGLQRLYLQNQKLSYEEYVGFLSSHRVTELLLMDCEVTFSYGGTVPLHLLLEHCKDVKTLSILGMFNLDTMKKLTELKPFIALQRVEFDFREPINVQDLCTFIKKHPHCTSWYFSVMDTHTWRYDLEYATKTLEREKKHLGLKISINSNSGRELSF